MNVRIRQLLLVTVLMGFLVSGCVALGNTPTGIGKKPGTGKGVISNLDPLNDGLYQMWIAGDNTYVYCTNDPALIDELNKIMQMPGNPPVIYEYRDWKSGDPEYEAKYDSYGDRISSTCGQYERGSSGSKLLSVKPANTPSP